MKNNKAKIIILAAGVIVLLGALLIHPLYLRATAFSFGELGWGQGALLNGKFYYTNRRGCYILDPSTRQAEEFDKGSSESSILVQEKVLYYTANHALYCYDTISKEETALFEGKQKEARPGGTHPLEIRRIVNDDGSLSEDRILLQFDRCEGGWLYDLISKEKLELSYPYQYRRDSVPLPDGTSLTLQPDPLTEETESFAFPNGTTVSVSLVRGESFQVLRQDKNGSAVLEEADSVSQFCFDGEWLIYATFGHGGHVYVRHIENKNGTYLITKSYRLK